MDIIIKTEDRTKFLRTEAMAHAIYYEENHLSNRKEGKQNWMHKSKQGTEVQYNFAIYHTKKAIVVEIF